MCYWHNFSWGKVLHTRLDIYGHPRSFAMVSINNLPDVLTAFASRTCVLVIFMVIGKLKPVKGHG